MRFLIKKTDNAIITPGIATKITKIKGPKGIKSIAAVLRKSSILIVTRYFLWLYCYMISHFLFFKTIS